MTTEWIALAGSLIPAIGLVFAGRQFMLGNKQAREDQLLGLRGVVVYWRAASAPNEAGVDGSAVWRYKVTVANPGRFPIDHVAICWQFALPVQRLHWDGKFDGPTQELSLDIPVLPGGGNHTWSRTLKMNFADAVRLLPATYAKVAFHDVNGVRQENCWPRQVHHRER